MSLEQCSNFTINGGSFSAVTGSQYNYHIQGNLLQLAYPRKERRVTAWDQYQELKAGDIRLKKKIAETSVWRPDAEGWRTWGNLDARRIIYTASVRGEDQGEEFLYVKYDGRDAVQAHRQDFEAFSAVKDINYVQLLGYSSWNALPSLVFYDTLVPVSHVFERNGFSTVLYLYFSYASLAQGIDPQTLLAELWIDPRSGTLCKGPYIEDSSTTLYQVSPGKTRALPCNNRPFLDLQTYNNTGLLFRWLTGSLPIRDIIGRISRSPRLTPEWPTNEDAKLILSSLPGTVYHRKSREIIARYPGDRKKWYYYPWKEQSRIPDVMQENTTMMKDGSVRFMVLKPVDIAHLESFVLYYDLEPVGLCCSFADSWVSQAHGIFSQLGIEEGEWERYSILDRFYLQFERERDKEGLHTRTNILISTPIYLFIRPIPDPSDDENGLEAWLGGRRYYWSYDSAGEEEVSECERRRLGLSSFKTTIEVWQTQWDSDVYNAIETEMVDRYEHFDFTSWDLARYLRYPILEFVDSSTRFEEVKADDDETLTTEIGLESAWLSTQFQERIRWIRAYRSLFSGHTSTSSSKDSVCSGAPDIADVD